MPVGISCPVSGHLTMTAPIELSLFRIVLFRLHTPQLYEPHLTRGRLVAEKLSNPTKAPRRYGGTWFEVTRCPTAEWLARQITEAFPWASTPADLVRDNDRAYGLVFMSRGRAMPGERGGQSVIGLIGV